MTFELSTLVTDFFVVHLAAERNASVLSGKFTMLIVRAFRYHSVWQDHISNYNSPKTIERFCVPGCEPPRPGAVWPKGPS